MFNKKNLKDIYTLSPMQQGMLFHSVLDSQSSAYIEQSEVLLEGDFDAVLFGQSWQTIIERHDVFRSVFVTKKTARPIQVVLKAVDFSPLVTDLSSLSEDEVHRELESFRQQDINAGFDLAAGPLFRLAMFKIDAEHTKVFWTFHHIIMDGWSLGLVLNELFSIYAALKHNQPLTLPTPVPYNLYIKWLATRDTQAGLDFWTERLKTIENQCLLPQRQDVKSDFDLAITPLTLDKTVFDQINGFCQQHGLTLNNYIQAVWALCLNLYTGQDELVFGKTVAGRSAQLPQAEDIVGLFINTLPVHIKLSAGESFIELVKSVQQDAFACDEYDWCSLAAIQNETALKSDLINHIIVFENYPLDADNGQWDDLDLGFKIKDVGGVEHTNYDFEIVAMPGDTLTLDVKYNRAKFDDDTINTVMSSFLQLCQKAVESPDSDYLTLNTVNNPAQYLADIAQAPADESVRAQFQRQVQNNPDGVALYVSNDIQMSYRELDEASNSFAAG
ncbi:MAG: condensation domain-containing protein, partial [Psychrosphaera sp.]|nr:condensation domain-containing protein [Psychrosphaera sp.]